MVPFGESSEFHEVSPKKECKIPYFTPISANRGKRPADQFEKIPAIASPIQ
jgi:hypothetical protein